MKHADNLLCRQLSTSSCLRGPEFLSSADEAVRDIPRCHLCQETKFTSQFIFSGSKLLVGGFGLCGIPENLIGGLVKSGARYYLCY